MAKTGIEYAIRAKLSEDGTYSGGTSFGPHSTFNGTPTVSDVKDYGDNRTVLTDKSVTGGTISIEVNDMANETYAECLGHTIDAEKKTVTCKVDDIPPLFGVGAVGTSRRETGYAYISKWYPKVQFKEPNDENSTRQENVTFTHVTLEGDLFQNDSGIWKETAEFDTLAAAKAWLDEKAGINKPAQS